MNEETIVDTGPFPYAIKGNREYRYFQFGLQRTGTNLVETTIQNNFRVFKANTLVPYDLAKPPSPDILTWKHSIWVPAKYRQGYPVILNYKNPYTWVESMLYREGQSKGAWGSTYKNVKLTLGKETLLKQEHPNDQTSFIIDSFVQTYRFWFDTWLDFYDNNKDITYLIKYEDLLYEDKRDSIMDEIADKFGWKKPEKYIWPDHCSPSKPIDEKAKMYYKSEQPMNLDRRQIDFISQLFDKDLMDRLGYNVL